MLSARLVRAGARHCAPAPVAGPSRAAWTESNTALDPRGVDYSVFEAPDAEYERAGAHLHETPQRTLPPSTALLRGLLTQRQYADAANALAQLQRLDTPLGPPLPEYALAAHWAAANRRVDDALRWITLLPDAAHLYQDTHDGACKHDVEIQRYLDDKVTQTVRWLCAARAGDEVLRAAHALGARGYTRGATTAVLFMCRTRPSDAWDAWRAAERSCATRERRARVYSRAFAALVRHGHWATARQWARLSAEEAPGAYPLSEAALRAYLERSRACGARPARGARSIPATEIDAKLAPLIARGDIVRARQVLIDGIMPNWRGGQRIPRRGGELPHVEHLAQFLELASRTPQTSGRFLKPVREALRAHRMSAFRTQGRSAAALLYASALLRSRELAGDHAGVFRVWSRRFEDSPGVFAEGAARPTELAPMQRANAYVAAVAVRTSVATTRTQAEVVELYRRFVGAIDRGDPAASPGCFEPFLRAFSMHEPRAFAHTLWTVFADMERVGAIARTTTWRVVLQGLARDGSPASWDLVCVVLRAIATGQRLADADTRIPSAFPTPLPTPVLYTGVLQVLAPEHDAPRGVWWNRSRQIANMAREHDVEDYAPLAAALRRVY